MKSLKLLAVAALFGAFFTSCEADSITEDEQLVEVEVISETGSDNKEVNSGNNDDD